MLDRAICERCVEELRAMRKAGLLKDRGMLIECDRTWDMMDFERNEPSPACRYYLEQIVATEGKHDGQDTGGGMEAGGGG